MSSISSRKKMFAGIAFAAVAALPLAACSSSDSAGSSSETKTAVAKPVARINALSGESTAIALDKGFTDALTSLKLEPGVVGTAKLEDGSLIFPITGGNVTYFKPGTVKPYVIGQVQHEGSGLKLTAGGIQVQLTNFNVDPGISRVYGDVTVNGKTVVRNAFLFQLRGATLKPLQVEGETAILEGTKVFISPVAAGLLNETYGTDAVTDKLLVGVAKITVNTTPAK
ncbi:hypothetical protein [Aeromicrobium stalagmiti]|uniref:hypothetical protein n=1 Tax=Aeromicrobium stalagmiti TaxID=2738988 RepID=UPI00156A2EC5|nr:hypothetical protein [Aeromicrobium stalagmiti]NRQ48819.1 hypothetical protein [Aeromicrobium stalagmiti]